jgi:hypothetical protein
MSNGPVSIEMRYGVSAFLATVGTALIAVSVINPSTFSPGISLLFLGILGFIANRVVYELLEKDYSNAGNVDYVLALVRAIAMIASAVIAFFLFLPLLPI